jgi:amidohydrolase
VNKHSLISVSAHRKAIMEDSLRIKQAAWQVIEERAPELRSLALRIHKHPELGWEEEKASQWLADSLAAHGFLVEKPFCGLETAFRAEKGTAPHPTVAFLAEYDALPGIGHGCGHNLIGPSALGAAFGVMNVLHETPGGRILVIGTPAEEFGGDEEGKLVLLERGAFDDVDAALLMHPMHMNTPVGGDLAVTKCEITFRGGPAHAAVDPWNGVNALDAIRLTFNGVDAARQQMRPDSRIHGIITDGGQAANCIPEKASAVFMVRAPEPPMMEEVYERLRKCARAAALATGARLTFRRVTTVLNTRPNATLHRLIADSFILLGETVEPPTKLSGSTDFGNVSHKLPAAWFMVRTHPKGIPWHSAEVHRASAREMALDGMITAAKVMAGVAIDLLCRPELLRHARDDFAGKTRA